MWKYNGKDIFFECLRNKKENLKYFYHQHVKWCGEFEIIMDKECELVDRDWLDS